MIASILPMIFINSIVDNIDTIDDVTYSNTYMLRSIWYDVDIDYITSMIPSTNSIDDIDSTIDDVTYSNTCMLDSMWLLLWLHCLEKNISCFSTHQKTTRKIWCLSQ